MRPSPSCSICSSRTRTGPATAPAASSASGPSRKSCRRSTNGSPASTRTTRILAADARGPLAAPESRRRRCPAAQADADLPRAPGPRRRHPRALLLARPARATRSSSCASRSTTSIPACGSKRSALSASSTASAAAKAQEIALESLVHPQDDYLEYTLNETTKTLDQRVKDQAKSR